MAELSVLAFFPLGPSSWRYNVKHCASVINQVGSDKELRDQFQQQLNISWM